MGNNSAKKKKGRKSRILKSKVIKKFRERVDSGALTEDVKVTYRIAGGMPSQRVEEEFRLSGSGKSKVVSRDILRSIPTQEGSGELDQNETRELLRKIGSGLDGLVPRSEAHFLPDSVVGSIIIEVDGEAETLYFLAEEGERLAQTKPISPLMTEAIQQIRKKSRWLLKKGKE